MIAWLDRGDPFPPVEQALKDPNGLLCAGADLSVARLLDAYRRGIFPWYSAGQPILWWSPDPRMVLRTDRLRVSRSLAKSRRNRGYVVTVDRAFEAVIEGCAAPRPAAESPDEAGTWIVPDMRAAYLRLFRAGFAHSVETWQADRLVGGLYGVAIDRMFYGESMFSRSTDASKVALVGLVETLRERSMPLIDCQMNTPLLASLGAAEIPRAAFLRQLSALVNYTASPSPWPAPRPVAAHAARAQGATQD